MSVVDLALLVTSTTCSVGAGEGEGETSVSEHLLLSGRHATAAPRRRRVTRTMVISKSDLEGSVTVNREEDTFKANWFTALGNAVTTAL